MKKYFFYCVLLQYNISASNSGENFNLERKKSGYNGDQDDFENSGSGSMDSKYYDENFFTTEKVDLSTSRSRKKSVLHKSANEPLREDFDIKAKNRKPLCQKMLQDCRRKRFFGTQRVEKCIVNDDDAILKASRKFFGILKANKNVQDYVDMLSQLSNVNFHLDRSKFTEYVFSILKEEKSDMSFDKEFDFFTYFLARCSYMLIFRISVNPAMKIKNEVSERIWSEIERSLEIKLYSNCLWEVRQLFKTKNYIKIVQSLESIIDDKDLVKDPKLKDIHEALKFMDDVNDGKYLFTNRRVEVVKIDCVKEASKNEQVKTFENTGNNSNKFDSRTNSGVKYYGGNYNGTNFNFPLTSSNISQQNFSALPNSNGFDADASSYQLCLNNAAEVENDNIVLVSAVFFPLIFILFIIIFIWKCYNCKPPKEKFSECKIEKNISEDLEPCIKKDSNPYGSIDELSLP